MSAFSRELWTHLVDAHGADRAVLPTAESRRRPRAIVAAVGAIAVAVTVAVVLALSATTGTPPAYALTQHADGTVTVTVHDIATAIPALNARFAQMGIAETVIPVRAGCPTRGLIRYPGASMSTSLTLRSGRRNLNPGFTGVLAAERLPDGQIGLTVGATRPPVPSCYSTVPLNLHLPASR
jgi:hypothetical protein